MIAIPHVPSDVDRVDVFLCRENGKTFLTVLWLRVADATADAPAPSVRVRGRVEAEA